jgi:excisionase family DNA binding protein
MCRTLFERFLMAAVAESPLNERIRRMSPVSAAPEERKAVAELSALLGSVAHRKKPRCELVGPDGKRRAIPEPVFRVLERVAQVLARGDAITVIPVGKELTTQQAADLLNVSRQYLVRLLDEGKLAHTKTGKHRRLRIEDVLAYQQTRDRERRATLDELTALSQEFGGYDQELK